MTLFSIAFTPINSDQSCYTSARPIISTPESSSASVNRSPGVHLFPFRERIFVAQHAFCFRYLVPPPIHTISIPTFHPNCPWLPSHVDRLNFPQSQKFMGSVYGVPSTMMELQMRYNKRNGQPWDKSVFPHEQGAIRLWQRTTMSRQLDEVFLISCQAKNSLDLQEAVCYDHFMLRSLHATITSCYDYFALIPL